jgi:hypothetical protein
MQIENMSAGVQNETGLEGVFSEDFGPTILWGVGRLGYDPELGMGMVNEGDDMAGGGTDRPTATEEIDLVVGVDAPSQMQGQMEIQQSKCQASLLKLEEMLCTKSED